MAQREAVAQADGGWRHDERRHDNQPGRTRGDRTREREGCDCEGQGKNNNVTINRMHVDRGGRRTRRALSGRVNVVGMALASTLVRTQSQEGGDGDCEGGGKRRFVGEEDDRR